MTDFQRLKGAANLIKLVKELRDVPAFLQKCVDDIQLEIKMVKELQEDLKKDSFLKELAEDGKFCNENKVWEPTRCYRLIYGTVTSTVKVDRKQGLEKLNSEGDPKGLVRSQGPQSKPKN
jgi:hypothetical protein